MAVREIIMIGDPILRQKAKKIHHFDPSLPKLVKDMFETMHDARGIGLAAPDAPAGTLAFFLELISGEPA
jgi:peptide deformylase